MMQNVSVYGHDKNIGFLYSDFEKSLPGNLEINDDEVYFNDYPNHSDIYEKKMSLLLGEDWIWIEESQYDLLQFTGMVDKNGVEVYEGDIVLFIRRNKTGIEATKHEVFFDTEQLCFQLRYNNEALFYCQFADEFEVIGNIYETPDLIK